MSKFHKPLLMTALVVLAVIVGLIFGSGGVEAQVQRPATPVEITGPLPVPVRVDSAPSQPFHATLCMFSNNGNCGQDPDRLALLPGQSAVIEFVSASCSTSSTDAHGRISLSTAVGGLRASYAFPLTKDAGFLVSDAAQQTRIYADPGTIIGINFASSSGPTPASVTCRMTISGFTTTTP